MREDIYIFLVNILWGFNMKKQDSLLIFTFIFGLVACGAAAATQTVSNLDNLGISTISETGWKENTLNLDIINNKTGGSITKNSIIMGYLPKTQLTQQIITAAKNGTPMITFGNGSYPRVMVVSGIHGDELPTQIAVMMLINNLQGKKIRGTLYVIPFAIPYSTEKNSRDYNGNDPNRMTNVPGTPTNVIFGVVKQKNVTYLGDFHATAGGDPKSVLCSKTPYTSFEIAKYIERLTGSSLAFYDVVSDNPGKLRVACNLAGIPAVTCEVLSPQGKVRSGSVEDSYDQIEAFLRYSNVLIAINRIAGVDRIETANKIAKAGWSSSNSAILTRSDLFPDALSGGPLSEFHSPILLTSTNQITESTLQTLQNLQTKKITILGGTSAVSQAVEDKLKQQGFEVERIAGSDRYETSAEIAEKLKEKGVNKVLIATGKNFPDALAAAPYAAKQNAAILLTDPNNLPASTRDAIIFLGAKDVTILGSTAAVSQNVEDQLKAMGLSVSRIAGSDRYETAVKIAEKMTSSKLIIATGENFPDALAGGAFAIKQDAIILLVRKDQVPQSVRNYLAAREGAFTDVWILGGEPAVSSQVEAEIGQILG